jgi:hypothetical protein
MIHQCYNEVPQRARLFDSPLYRGFGLYTAVNPCVGRNCPELDDPRVQQSLCEYGAMLHFWRNADADPDPWIGFTSYRQLDKFPTILTDRESLETRLARGDVAGWGFYAFAEARTRRPITLAEQGERCHPGMTSALWRVLLLRGDPLPRNYVNRCDGLFCNYWAMSKANFADFMAWSFPLVQHCLAHPDAYCRSHPRAVAYLAERLFVCWYGLREKRLWNVGPLVEVFFQSDPSALGREGEDPRPAGT